MFPHIVVDGPPYVRGRQHAEQARPRIFRALAHYRERFAATGDLDWDAVRKRVRSRYLPAIAEHLPEALDEMRGIAVGLDVDLEDVIALNARYELLRPFRPSGCTSVAVLPEASGGSTLLAQNWDFHPGVLETAVVLEVIRPDGEPLWMLTEAGQLGRLGMSGDGLGVAVDGLVSAVDGGGGAPVSLYRRAFLESGSFADGVRRIESLPRPVSNNLLLAADGEGAVDIELWTAGSCRIDPERGLLTHANHFKGERHPADLVRPQSSTYFRDRRLYSLLAAHRGGIDRDTLHGALSDHQGAPGSICRHGDDEHVMTVASIVMDLTAKVVDLWYGPPCEGQHTRYRLVAGRWTSELPAFAPSAAPPSPFA